MSESKKAAAARFPLRRGLSQAEAAIYIGVGTTKFRLMVEARTMPRPRLIGTRRVWDIDDLDAAFKSLPIEGEDAPNPWHDNFPPDGKENWG